MCPPLNFRSYAKYSGDDVSIQQEVFIGDEIFISSPLIRISEALGRLYVTNGCNHSYYKEFKSLKSSEKDGEARDL